MMHRRLLIVVFFAGSLYSCKKNIETRNPPDPNLSFLGSAVSDSCSDSSFYIKGEFNGHQLCFATTGQAGSFLVDTFSNAFFIYHYDNIKKDSSVDNLYLIRQNANNSIMIALYCGQTHIKNRDFPYTQPHQNLERCEFTVFEFINMNHDYNIVQNSSQDNYTFQGITGFGMTVTFVKLTYDDIIEGEFEGTLRTNTGSIITVKDGKFRIKFVISHQLMAT